MTTEILITLHRYRITIPICPSFLPYSSPVTLLHTTAQTKDQIKQIRTQSRSNEHERELIKQLSRPGIERATENMFGTVGNIYSSIFKFKTVQKLAQADLRASYKCSRY